VPTSLAAAVAPRIRFLVSNFRTKKIKTILTLWLRCFSSNWPYCSQYFLQKMDQNFNRRYLKN